jgi:hypothetical protein
MVNKPDPRDLLKRLLDQNPDLLKILTDQNLAVAERELFELFKEAVKDDTDSLETIAAKVVRRYVRSYLRASTDEH